jgi:hypothetical protein
MPSGWSICSNRGLVLPKFFDKFIIKGIKKGRGLLPRTLGYYQSDIVVLFARAESPNLVHDRRKNALRRSSPLAPQHFD